MVSRRLFLTAVLTAMMLNVGSLSQCRAVGQDTPTQGYLRFQRAIYYAKRLDDIYPTIPDGVVKFYQPKDKAYKDERLAWYKEQYIAQPVVVNEFIDGYQADLQGNGTLIANGRPAKVTFRAHMTFESDLWRVSRSYYDGQQWGDSYGKAHGF